MKQKLHPIYLLLLSLLILQNNQAEAQINRTPYTGSNRVLVALEGTESRYEFMSDQMLVRYNRENQQLECILPVSTLVPLHDTIPANMANEVLFEAKYPQLFISMAAPVQEINAGNLSPETMRRTTSIRLQGITNQAVLPVSFITESRSLYFSTSFDLMLDNFQASLPVAYLPLLTGRIFITIDRARLVDLEPR
ncbi:hypothetical protein POKO110462_22760 [Pontibacter korlensis]|uniref:Lipid/polyisoprenoid-binding YceI-like domain-containing protein n=1 Tax=Pontibacter korlensis TaxID=400092 RepID=A0A0E3ZH27_9BACT|nr:hypothetical protein [Pontibacter korlensis]AKD04558.1 hypothetical protein PKOR_17475 [Pontibacter korlensis]